VGHINFRAGPGSVLVDKVKWRLWLSFNTAYAVFEIERCNIAWVGPQHVLAAGLDSRTSGLQGYEACQQTDEANRDAFQGSGLLAYIVEIKIQRRSQHVHGVLATSRTVLAQHIQIDHEKLLIRKLHTAAILALIP